MNQWPNNVPLISFCISTYNRGGKIVKLVKDILKYEGKDIEVIVSDNCSKDNTVLELSKIEDERFRYFSSDTNIGAIQNYIKVVSKGDGQNIIFCTDKDYINTSGIPALIDFFKNNPNVIAGYCQLDIYKNEQAVLCSKGIDGLKRMAYLSQHPTGYFFKNKVLKSLNILDNYISVEKIGVFPFEFIIADMCMLGQTAIIKLPLFYIETMMDVKNIKSYSYSGAENNLYFAPHQRFKMLQKYVTHLETLDLPDKEKKEVVKCIFRYGLSSATLGYKLMMKNNIICDHYSISTENIGIVKLIKYDYNFCRSFIMNCAFSNVASRIAICLEIHLEYILKKLDSLILGK